MSNLKRGRLVVGMALMHRHTPFFGWHGQAKRRHADEKRAGAQLRRAWTWHPTRRFECLVALGALGAAALNSHGCAATRGELRPSVKPATADIPLPSGFRLREQSSEDWASGPVRYLRHRYEGRADQAAVREFYRREMPLLRWTAIEDGSINGRVRMRFERERETCTVTMEDSRGVIGSRVVVEATITPKLTGNPTTSENSKSRQ